jgi:hypothetical protein
MQLDNFGDELSEMRKLVAQVLQLRYPVPQEPRRARTSSALLLITTSPLTF